MPKSGSATHNARSEVGERGQCHTARTDICRIDFRAVDEARCVDEETVEEHEEHQGEDSDLLSRRVWNGDCDVLAQHRYLEDERY